MVKMLVAFVSSKYTDLINVFISDNFDFSAFISFGYFPQRAEDKILF